MRIGELARRAGLPSATLRAWERRYGIVSPTRDDSSGYRLYSRADERRLRRMGDLVDGGLAPAEAARQTREEAEREGAPDREPAAADLRQDLAAALAAFDDRAADQVLDRAVTVLSTDGLLNEVLLPVLRDLADGTIGQEHFASNLIRGRMLGLARGWGGGAGRLALLACPGGEQHDLGLITFGLALRDRGWRIAFLGADTPIDALAATAAATKPEVVAMSAICPRRFMDSAPDLKRLSKSTSMVLGGPGASELVCADLGAVRLADGPVEEAAALSN